MGKDKGVIINVTHGSISLGNVISGDKNTILGDGSSISTYADPSINWDLLLNTMLERKLEVAHSDSEIRDALSTIKQKVESEGSTDRLKTAQLFLQVVRENFPWLSSMVIGCWSLFFPDIPGEGIVI